MRVSKRATVGATVLAMTVVGLPAFAGGHGGGGGGGGNPGTKPYIEFKGGGMFAVTEGTTLAVIQVERVPKGSDVVNFSTNGSPNGAMGAATCSDPATDYIEVSNASVAIGSNGVGVANVTICNNSFFENSELVNLVLSQQSGTPVGGKITGTLTINDNDKAPVLSVDNKSGVEGSTKTFTVTASSADPLLPMSVHWSTSDGTATVADDDYAAQSGDVAIAPGNTTTTFNVASIDDSVYEPGTAQYFWLNLSAPVNSSISSTNGSGKFTLTDNDTAPTLSVNDVTDWEGTTLGFTVTRTGLTDAAATFDWTTAAGTASAQSIGPNNVCGAAVVPTNDYVSAAATGVSIAAGGATGTATLNVSTCQDSVAEDNETFDVMLANAGAATLSDDTGVGTIKDDDAASLTMAPKSLGGNTPADTVTYTATVKNTAGDELKGVLVRFEAYASDSGLYDQVDLTGPGFAGFDTTGDGADVNSSPATESDGEATLVLPPTGATFLDVVLGCVVSSVAATPACAGTSDGDGDADGDPRTGHNVDINSGAFTPLEDDGFAVLF